MSHLNLEFLIMIAATDIANSNLTIIAHSNRQRDQWYRQDSQRDSANKRAVCDVWCTCATTILLL